MESDSNMQIPRSAIDSSDMQTDSIKTWQFETVEEAKEVFGDHFLTPSYIPAGFKLDSINGHGQNKDAIDILQLNYVSGKSSFVITQNKNFTQDNYFTQYKAIDINGAEGYVNSFGLNGQKQDNGDAEDGMVAELHWIANNVHYMVSGAISESEAISIARSMK